MVDNNYFRLTELDNGYLIHGGIYTFYKDGVIDHEKIKKKAFSELELKINEMVRIENERIKCIENKNR